MLSFVQTGPLERRNGEKNLVGFEQSGRDCSGRAGKKRKGHLRDWVGILLT